ncbi:hypothetical protein [Sinomicrobium oceani]|jgi:hypothetical protein|uniref:hypothetical protein n=1 Tax=Sinomicrobium oceani TaxID=1150368 RepID=UPI00227D69F9|nr:hypothetical protein [Sinomicrobium oceani]|tara:strand:- start:224 stop:421 length:198 start_codon:yes stop_codon:yes gene_type:complete
MTKKQEKEYEDEIRALNSILLEMKDHANALGHERDRWRELAIVLMKKLGIPYSEEEEPENLIDKL